MFNSPVRRIALILLIVATSIVSLAGTSQADHADSHIITIPRFSSFQTDGTWLVWNQYPESGEFTDPSPLSVLNLTTNETVPIVNSPDGILTGSYAIENGIVAWSDVTPRDILARDLASGESFAIANSDEDERLYGLSSTWAVYWSGEPDTGRFLARNIDTLADPIPLVIPANNGGIILDGDRLFWWVNREGIGHEIYMLVLGEGEPTLITTTEVELGYGPIVVGDDLVYGTRASGDEPWQYVAHDLASGEVRLLEGLEDGFSFAGADDRYILHEWQEVDGVGATMRFAYDLESDELFTLMVSREYMTLAIVGDTLYYSQALNVSGGTEIYMAPLSEFLLPVHAIDPATAPDDWTFFQETGHYLHAPFKTFWNASGGLPVFGYPMTEQFKEQSADLGTYLTTQFFERQRFEHHPQNAGTPYEVQLGRLGDESLLDQGRNWASFPKVDPSTPHFFPETGHAIAEQFYDYWTGHGLEFGDDGISYRESLALFGYPISEPMMETNADGDTVLTQYFERAVFEHHPEHAGTPFEVLLRRVGVEMLWERGWP